MIEKPQIEMSSEETAEPIRDNPRKPEMTDRQPRPRRISGKVHLMEDQPAKPKSGANRMPAVPKKRATERQRGERPEQRELEQRKPQRTERLGYVRLRVHVQGGEMSVLDIASVEGPLVAHEALHGDYAYEVIVSGKRVASGSIPDAGVMRSFPHPKPAKGQEGHHFTPATSFDFLVRIPKSLVSESKLRRVQIPVYRIKEGPLPQTEGPEPLAERFERQLREVGRLHGVDIDKLPKSSQARARNALR